MNSLIRKSTTPLGAIVFAALFFILLAFIAMTNVTHADSGNGGGRLITIHDRGEERVVLTKATTVGDALKEAGLVIDSNDSVEPAANEKLIANDYQVNIYRARPVLVVDGSIRLKVITPYQTAEQIASKAGIVLYHEDKAIINRVNDLTSGAGLQLTITRATPFIFTLYGKTATVRTQGSTIGEMLAEKGIKLTKDDHVSLPQDTKLTEGLEVKVWREGKQTITVDEAVNFEVQKIEDADRDVTFREVKSAGENGMRSATYEIIIKDGQEVGRKEIASLIIKQPIKQIELVGVKGQYTTPSENETITWNYLIANGYSRVQTAGIMGNLMQEHHFNTTGDGLAQWTGGRKNALFSLPYPTNIYTQLGFLIHELNTNYASVGAAIKSTDSLTEAVQIFQNKFERCGVCMESNRIEYARDILASH